MFLTPKQLMKRARIFVRNTERKRVEVEAPKELLRGSGLISDRQCWHQCPSCKKSHCHYLNNRQRMEDLDEYFKVCKDCLLKHSAV